WLALRPAPELVDVTTWPQLGFPSPWTSSETLGDARRRLGDTSSWMSSETRPGVAQGDDAVVDRSVGAVVRIGGEVAEAFELADERMRNRECGLQPGGDVF